LECFIKFSKVPVEKWQSNDANAGPRRVGKSEVDSSTFEVSTCSSLQSVVLELGGTAQVKIAFSP
jgi:hypothetical protein